MKYREYIIETNDIEFRAHKNGEYLEYYLTHDMPMRTRIFNTVEEAKQAIDVAIDGVLRWKEV